MDSNIDQSMLDCLRSIIYQENYWQNIHNPQPDSDSDGEDISDSDDDNQRDDDHGSNDTNGNAKQSQEDEIIVPVRTLGSGMLMMVTRAPLANPLEAEIERLEKELAELEDQEAARREQLNNKMLKQHNDIKEEENQEKTEIHLTTTPATSDDVDEQHTIAVEAQETEDTNAMKELLGSVYYR